MGAGEQQGRGECPAGRKRKRKEETMNGRTNSPGARGHSLQDFPSHKERKGSRAVATQTENQH